MTKPPVGSRSTGGFAMSEDDQDWRFYSRCANDPKIQSELSERIDRFHDYEEGNLEWAKKYCRGCPVRTPCLNWALELHKTGNSFSRPKGIWGGTTQKERAHILLHRGRLQLKA